MIRLAFVGAMTLLTACTSLPSSYEVPSAPDIASPPATDNRRSYFVDPLLLKSPCTRYHAAERTCGDGNELAFSNLADANGLAEAGDAVYLRTGSYSEQIRPERSGSPAAPIRYQAYNDEHVEIAHIDAPAIWLQDVQYVEVQGLNVHDVQGWARLQNAHNNKVSNNDFSEAQARGTTGGFKLVDSHYNQITNNTFYRGNDSIVIQSSDRNLVADNHFEFARHSLFSIRCGNFNILRNNYLHNERQKIGEIYDCEAVSDAPYRLNATKRNLVEGNHFAFTRGSDQPTRYNGIQFAGQLTLVRGNLFKQNEGGAIHFAVYSDEALNNYGNRVVANWFFDNRCYALSASNNGGVRVGDNRVIGNLLSGNVDCLGYKRGILKAPGMTAVDNQEVDTPTQVLPRAWIARTLAEGSGSSLPLDDVLSFYDGYGIKGEVADTIEIESTGERAQVVAIDYQAQTLRLNTSVSWNANDGVRVHTSAARTPFTVVPFSRLIRE